MVTREGGMSTTFAPGWAAFSRVFPVAAVAAAAVALATVERGSIGAADWLPYALGAALLLAAVLLSGAAVVPPAPALVAAGALAALAGWHALSISWSPAPGVGAFSLAPFGPAVIVAARRTASVGVRALALGAGAAAAAAWLATQSK